MLKKFFKKYWLIFFFSLFINIPIVIMGTIRTNKDVTLKGDTVNVNNFIQVDTNYEEKGSFSSIYVVNFEHSTILQNLIVSTVSTADSSNLNIDYNSLSDLETYKAGQIQKASSISKAIIVAYEACKPIVNIDYSFSGYEVTYYSKKSSLRVGDRIVKINDVSCDVGLNDFRNELYGQLYDDELDSYTILRDNQELVFTEEDIDYNNFGAYEMFDINYETLSPKITIKSTNVGGPSGGLMQTLAIYNKLNDEDYSKGYKISGTGTINLDGTVGKIGGIKQKVYTAFQNDVDIFFCPEENYEEALEAYNNLNNKEKMVLVPIKYFGDAIYLLEIANDKKV